MNILCSNNSAAAAAIIIHTGKLGDRANSAWGDAIQFRCTFFSHKTDSDWARTPVQLFFVPPGKTHALLQKNMTFLYDLFPKVSYKAEQQPHMAPTLPLM